MENTNKINWLSVLEQSKIDPKEVIPPVEIAWEQIDSSGGENLILGTLENFSLIIGKAKSKKSFFINIAVSVALSKDTVLGMFRGGLKPSNNKVLYFDTEQGKRHTQEAYKRICKQIKIEEPENLEMYYLRKYNPLERLQMIEEKIYSTEGLGFVVIDGIKDLVTSINDEEQATKISSKLLKWTEEKKIHIICVLHQNKSDNNARGHIGTELINKAETVLSVTVSEKDKSISIVEPQQCRNKEPNPFAFEIIDNLPAIVEDYEIRTKSTSKKFDLSTIEDFKKFEVLTEIFSKEDNIKYAELWRQVKYTFKKKLNYPLGDNRAKDLVTEFKDKNWIVQSEDKKPYTLGSYT
jgi:hypothetical protein